MNTHPDFSDSTPAQEPSGYCVLAGLGLLRVSGEDAAQFLQGQVTCDVAALPEQRTGLGAICNPKGRVLASFRLIRSGGSFYLLLAADLAETIRKRLQIYVLRSRVVVENLSTERRIIGLCGAGFEAFAESLGLILPEEPGTCLDQPDLLSCRFDDGTGRTLVAAGKESGRGLLEGLSKQCPDLNSETWRLKDIRAGIPEVVAATAEEYLPQMLNLDLLGAVGFKKGCYTGQEIITRTHFLGQIKRRMFRLGVEVHAVPEAGVPVFDGAGAEPKNVGSIVTAARTASGTLELLAVLGLEYGHSDNLRLASPDGPELHRLALPYSLEPSPA